MFFINMDISADLMARIIGHIDTRLDTGINALGMSACESVTLAGTLGVNNVWTDFFDQNDVPTQGPAWFAGVAHKGNQWVPDDDLASTAKHAATFCEVPTMTGYGTGVAAEASRMRLYRAGLPDGHRMGLASGVTPENVTEALDAGVTDILCATGISDTFYELNPARTAQLASTINGWKASDEASQLNRG